MTLGTDMRRPVAGVIKTRSSISRLSSESLAEANTRRRCQAPGTTNAERAEWKPIAVPIKGAATEADSAKGSQYVPTPLDQVRDCLTAMICNSESVAIALSRDMAGSTLVRDALYDISMDGHRAARLLRTIEAFQAGVSHLVVGERSPAVE